MNRADWSKIGAVEARHYRGKVIHFSSLREALTHRFSYRAPFSWYLRKDGKRGDMIDGEIRGANRRGYLMSQLSSPAFTGIYWTSGDYWLLRDELGMLIPLWRIQYELEQLGLYWQYGDKDYYPGGRKWRRGPVVRHSRRSWRHGRHSVTQMRWMQTTSEHRANCALEGDEDLAELGIKLLPRRKDLPSAWDDKMTRRSAGWKSHRRHQYKD